MTESPDTPESKARRVLRTRAAAEPRVFTGPGRELRQPTQTPHPTRTHAALRRPRGLHVDGPRPLTRKDPGLRSKIHGCRD